MGVRPDPAARGCRLQDSNLLVSVLARAPGRARREIEARLRALGDPASVVIRTGRRGLVAVSTSLDRHDAWGGRNVHETVVELTRQ
jgi:hypothetical protein